MPLFSSSIFTDAEQQAMDEQAIRDDLLSDLELAAQLEEQRRREAEQAAIRQRVRRET